MNAALFWFYKGNDITDEPAFDSLKDSDMQAAIEIWSKLTAKGEITKRNSSAFQNLSTLFLCNSLNGSSANATLFKKGIILKLRFLESDFVEDLKAAATDKTYKASKKDIQIAYLNAVYEELEKHGGVTSNKLIQILNNENFIAKEDYFKGFVQKPIEQIEIKIEDSKVKRKSNKSNAAKEGKRLYQQTSESLSQIKEILGSKNLKFSSISDKVSNEVLQCGIDYFVHYRDTRTDPGNTSLNLFRKAEELAIGGIAIQRCQENMENLEEWIADKPERDKQQQIIIDLEKVMEIIDKVESLNKTVDNAKLFLASTRKYLFNIRSILGSNDEYYLDISSRIASDAQGMCVSEINKLHQRIDNSDNNITKLSAIISLKELVNKAWGVTIAIGLMDLRHDIRNNYLANRNSLSNLKTQLANIDEGTGGGSGTSACYIATMVYGDCNHPQVIILRQFRDTVLNKSNLGKWFIRIYYNYSPILVSKLTNKLIKLVIRDSLNIFIHFIK